MLYYKGGQKSYYVTLAGTRNSSISPLNGGQNLFSTDHAAAKFCSIVSTLALYYTSDQI